VDAVDLDRQAGQHPHDRGHARPVGVGEQLGRGELVRLQRLVDRHGARVQLPPAASTAKHAHQVSNGEAATTRWGRRRGHHRQRLRAGQLSQGGQRGRVELPQRAAKLVASR
jgi:hypothetical protein